MSKLNKTIFWAALNVLALLYLASAVIKLAYETNQNSKAKPSPYVLAPVATTPDLVVHVKPTATIVFLPPTSKVTERRHLGKLPNGNNHAAKRKGTFGMRLDKLPDPNPYALDLDSPLVAKPTGPTDQEVLGVLTQAQTFITEALTVYGKDALLEPYLDVIMDDITALAPMSVTDAAFPAAFHKLYLDLMSLNIQLRAYDVDQEPALV